MTLGWEKSKRLFNHWLLLQWLLPVLGGWPRFLRDDAIPHVAYERHPEMKLYGFRALLSGPSLRMSGDE